MIQPTPRIEALRAFGLSDTNTPINKDRLLYRLSEACGYNAEEIYKVLQDNPERDKDKKPIMRKTGRESSINSTTGQVLGDVIDNMPYYVDSCAWWVKGWNGDKYKARLKRDSDKYKAKPKKRIFSKTAKYLKDKELAD